MRSSVHSIKCNGGSILILLFAIIIFITKDIKPQWIQTNGPGGGEITSIVGNGNEIIAGTYQRGPYISTNDGSDWHEIVNGFPSSHGITSLMVNGRYIYAGVENPSNTSGIGAYITSDDGLNWTQILSGRWVYSFGAIGDIILAGTNAGIYLTTNNGAFWRQINNGLPTNASVYSITNYGNKIFAGTNGGGPNSAGGIYVSSDSGSSWVLSNKGLQYRPDIANSMIKNYDLARNNIISRHDSIKNQINNSLLLPLNPTVYTITGSGNNIFAGTTEGTYISADTGATWTLITDGLIYGEYVYSIAVSGHNTFAATSGGVYITTNDGKLWTEVSEGLPASFRVHSLYINGSRIFAGTDGGVYVSDDNGGKWTEMNKGLFSNGVTSLGAIGGTIFAGTFSFGIGGVNYSTDAGENWALSNAGVPANTWIIEFDNSENNIIAASQSYVGQRGIFFSTNNGLSWSHPDFPYIQCFSLSANGNNVFAGTDYGLFRSTDAGASWLQTNNGINAGFNVDAIANIGNDVYAEGISTITWLGEFYHSTNNGSSWFHIDNGLPVNTMVIDGNDIYAGGSSGVYLSTNKGSTWTAKNNGIEGRNVTYLLINGSNLYAGTSYGVYISSDKGSTWNQFNNGTILGVSSLVILDDYLLAGTGVGVWKQHITVSKKPIYNCTIANDVLVSDSIYEFDINLLSTGNYAFELAEAQLGLAYNNAIKNGGVLSAAWVPGSVDSAIIASGQENTTFNASIEGLIQIASVLPPGGAGTGAIISNIAPGTRIGRLRITNSIPFAKARPDIKFIFSDSLYGTKISAYVPAGVGGTETTITDSSNFIFNQINPTLPVELISLEASIVQNSVKIIWSTATELNNQGFEIERAALNNLSVPERWVSLGFVKGSGNSTSSKEYSYIDKSIKANGKYGYRLKQIDYAGTYKYSNSAEANVNFLHMIYSLENNYPNPFNPGTLIGYSIPVNSNVKLSIYNTLGQIVKVLISQVQTAGKYEISFDGSGLSSGTYFYAIQAVSNDGNQKYTDTKKMLLLK